MSTGPHSAPTARAGVDPTRDPQGDGVWQVGLVQLYEERLAALTRIAYLLVGRRDIAEELTQDAFVAANRTWDGVRDPYPYVRAAIVNRARSWHRRNAVEHRHRPAPPDPVLLEPDEMWDALATLDDRRRTAIVLRFYEDLPDQEIAEVLACEPATVRTLVHRGLKDLRREMKQ